MNDRQKAQVVWSTPYHGVQHTDRNSHKEWVTVVDRGCFAELTCWFVGWTPYSNPPLGETFGTVEAARAAGEAWMLGRPA